MPGLPDLRRVRVPAGVDDGARRADRAAERARELLDDPEAFRAAEPAASGDDDVRVLDRRALRLLVSLLAHGRLRRVLLERHGRLSHGRRAARGRRLEAARPEEREPRLRGPADVDDDGVSERRALADELPILLDEVDEVPVQARVQPRRQTGGDVRGQDARGEEHRVEPVLLDERCEHVDARLRQRRREARVVGDEHRLRAEPPASRRHSRRNR